MCRRDTDCSSDGTGAELPRLDASTDPGSHKRISMMAEHRELRLYDAPRLPMEIRLRLTQQDFWRFPAKGPVVCRHDTDSSSDWNVEWILLRWNAGTDPGRHKVASSMAEHEDKRLQGCFLTPRRCLSGQTDPFCGCSVRCPVMCRRDTDCFSMWNTDMLA